MALAICEPIPAQTRPMQGRAVRMEGSMAQAITIHIGILTGMLLAAAVFA